VNSGLKFKIDSVRMFDTSSIQTNTERPTPRNRSNYEICAIRLWLFYVLRHTLC